MIISVSRRCDIPRFKFDWFLEKLNEGFVEVLNPFNSRQKRRISLLPPALGTPSEECAEVFAFWTRDPTFITEHAEELEKRGYGFFVMTTLTAYPVFLEPNVPSSGTVIQKMRILAQKITADRVIWRYDPVFLSEQTDFAFHRRNFSGLAAALNGTVKRVIVSVYDEYPGAEKRFAVLEKQGILKRQAHYGPEGPNGERPLLPPVRELLGELACIARKEGMEIQSCAEENLLDSGIRPGACIDGEYISTMFGIKTPGRDKNQKRPRCLCAKSADIGSYGHCPAGCVYCYGLRGGR